MFYCKKEALLSWQTTELPFMAAGEGFEPSAPAGAERADCIIVRLRIPYASSDKQKQPARLGELFLFVYNAPNGVWKRVFAPNGVCPLPL